MRVLFSIALGLTGFFGIVSADISTTMRENIFRMLERANELRDEGNVRGAEELYGRLLNFRLNIYETAVVHQNVGVFELNRENYAAVIDHFERAVATRALPKEITSVMEANLIQLYMTQEAYQKTLDLAADWIPRQEDPSVQIFVTAASAATSLQQFDLAVQYIQEAIERSEKPEENWYRLLVALHYERQDSVAASEVLHTMIRLFPENDEYWRQLAALYINMGREMEALGVLEAAHEKGLLNREEELLQLVNLKLFLDIPYDGSRLLSAGLDKGLITGSRSHFELLANAFLRARENREALGALLRAAEMADDGNLHLRVAQVYVELEDWSSALRHLRLALEKGNLRNPGLPYLLMGYALYSLEEEAEAVQVFLAGLEIPEIAAQCRQWISYLDPALAESLEAAEDGDSGSVES